jgi:hypothetical protein
VRDLELELELELELWARELRFSDWNIGLRFFRE